MKKDNNLLDYVPRIPEKLNWTEDDEHRVTVDVENKGVFNRIAQKCFGRPAVSHIALEQFGSFIWKQIDGVHTIYDIALLVKEEFGEDAEPLYDRLLAYFRTLQGHGFVTLTPSDKDTKREESLSKNVFFYSFRVLILFVDKVITEILSNTFFSNEIVFSPDAISF